MWDKYFRLCLFMAVYQELFAEELGADLGLEWDFILETVENPQDRPSSKELAKSMASLRLKREQYELLLKKYLHSWERTYETVKAMLLTFLEELSKLREVEEKSELIELVGKYVRLTQDYIGGENTALVHAVASNIVENDLEGV
jgi:transcription termination factor NusB